MLDVKPKMKRAKVFSSATFRTLSKWVNVSMIILGLFSILIETKISFPFQLNYWIILRSPTLVMMNYLEQLQWKNHPKCDWMSKWWKQRNYSQKIQTDSQIHSLQCILVRLHHIDTIHLLNQKHWIQDGTNTFHCKLKHIEFPQR